MFESFLLSSDFWLMSRPQDLFNEAVNFSSHIDFSTIKVGDTIRHVILPEIFRLLLSDCFLISVFETTIRFVGGLLAAYELSDFQHPGLLAKAKEVADKMAFAWVGDNDVPFGHIAFANNTPQFDTVSHYHSES